MIRLSSYLLNANSFHFLNYARPSSFKLSVDKVLALRSELSESFVSSEDVVIDGSFVMELYGLKVQ